MTFKLTEKAFQAQVVELGLLLGWRLQYHTFDSRRSAAGFPDLVMVNIVQKRLLFAELKILPRRPTNMQETWLGYLRACGQEAYLWYPEDWAVIQRILEGKHE